MIELVLPWPPSVNHYYAHVGRRVIISKQGRAYRKKVCSLLAELGLPCMTGPLSIEIEAYPPDDGRERDLDNHDGKALQDALQHAGVLANDREFKKRNSVMCNPVKGGAMIVRIEPYVQAKTVSS